MKADAPLEAARESRWKGWRSLYAHPVLAAAVGLGLKGPPPAIIDTAEGRKHGRHGRESSWPQATSPRRSLQPETGIEEHPDRHGAEQSPLLEGCGAFVEEIKNEVRVV